jgi:hypothetical protein
MSLQQFVTQFLGNNSAIGDVVRVVNGMQKNLQSIFSQLTKQVQNQTVLLQNISIVVGNNSIPHSLGQNCTGYYIVKAQTAYPLLVVTKPSDNQYLYVTSNVACTISLEVF